MSKVLTKALNKTDKLLKELAKATDKKKQRKIRRQLRKLGHEGGLGDQCDERCWNAKGDKCHCVCGGANHGKDYGKKKRKKS